MKKKKTANAIMVAVIAVIVVGGVLVAGHIRGWFDKTPEAAVLTDYKGVVTIEREGVAYNVQEDTALRKGDKISLAPDATVKISLGGTAGESKTSRVVVTASLLTSDTGSSAEKGSIVLGESAVLTVEDPSQRNFKASISAGEAFVSAKDAPVDISFDGKEVTLKQAAAALSIRAGAQSMAVYSGEVDGVAAGNVKEWVGTESSVYELDINSLNDFVIAQIRAAGDGAGLVIAKADVDALVEKRQAEKEAAIRQAEEEAKAEAERKAAEEAARKAEEEQKAAEEAAAKAEADRKAAEEAKKKAEEAKKAAEEAAKKAQSEEEKKAAEEAARKAEEEARKAEEERKAAEEAARKAAEEEAARKAEEERKAKEEEERRKAEEEAKKNYCYISIRCDTILNNLDDLDPAKAPYVPSNGWILGKKKVEFEEGETVCDVLKRVCSNYGIQLEYSWTPAYNSYYIEGIHHLYEFDCGPESGWMYKVNGWFPNYGCSSYYLKKDDNIVWCYTCKGLGADVGAPPMN